jgi:rubrerythrin
LSAGLPEKQPETEQVKVGLNAIYNWNYDSDVDSVRALYANALDRQWIALRDLDWDSGIDREKFSKTFSVAGIPLHGTQWWKHLDPELKWSVARKTSAFMLSNFLHGEQGALMVAGEMVNAVPHMDAKFYAATQTMDEARHVEAFAAYINLLDEVRPIMPSLKEILDKTIGCEGWMHKAVGMQVVVEGLALYTFRDMRNATEEPLMKEMLTYISRDEARHCAYGVKYLGHVVETLSDKEREDLEDFGFEAARLLISSRSGTSARESMFEVWREAGLDPMDAINAIRKENVISNSDASGQGPAGGPIRGFVIPTLKALGLFSERIEGHFRELFATNMGEEKAMALEFGWELPEDLEGWVLSG